MAPVKFGSEASANRHATTRPTRTCTRAQKIVTEFLNQNLILFHIDAMSELFDQIYLRAMTPRLAASAAISKAFDFTSATRLQPRPNTGQVFSDWRKCSRSSQIAVTKALGSIADAAATTSSVTTLVLPGSLRIRLSTLPLRPMPEFTPYWVISATCDCVSMCVRAPAINALMT